MSTPLEVRNRRREAQRTIRLSLNAIMSSLNTWKAAITEGKKHATNLTNDILTSDHIPQLPLAALQTIPGLKHACLTKLACQRQRHLQALLNCLETLEIALCSLSEAVSQVTAISQIEDSQPMLRGGPVFTSLTLTLITTMLQRIESMYEAELAIKKVVAEDFRNACAQAEQRANTSSPNSFKYLSNLSNTSKQLSSSTDNRTSANSTISANSTSGQISNGGSRSGDEVESFLQVHITAWMLSAEIDEGGVEADLAFITQDANSC